MGELNGMILPCFTWNGLPKAFKRSEIFPELRFGNRSRHILKSDSSGEPEDIINILQLIQTTNEYGVFLISWIPLIDKVFRRKVNNRTQ